MNILAVALVGSFILAFFVIPKLSVQISKVVLGRESIPLVLVLNLLISFPAGYLLGLVSVFVSGL